MLKLDISSDPVNAEVLKCQGAVKRALDLQLAESPLNTRPNVM